MKNLEFYFDFVSPYTYLAAYRLRHDPLYKDITIEWQPVLLGGIFKLAGNRPPAEVQNKGAYMLRDLLRMSDYYGIPYNWPLQFPLNSLRLMRTAVALKQRDPADFHRYVDAMFDAYWHQGVDISDESQWRPLVAALGLDATALVEEADSPAIKEALKANTAYAVERGIFGLPAFFVGPELYWGFDRMFLVERELGLHYNLPQR